MSIVSIIIPFYNGNHHLEKLKSVLECCAKRVYKKVLLEVVLVNDSPWVQVDKKLIISEQYQIKIITHLANQGIHKARITGFNNAKGEYIVFLDQDDLISEDSILHLYENITKNKSDCVIGNGLYETTSGVKLIMDSYGKVHYSQKYYAYLILGNFICSPGQCMIRKKAIPEYWTTHIVKSNCSDDLFLWCLLFKNAKISYCNKLVYRHVNTGVNFSLDIKNGYISDLEVYKYLINEKSISSIYLNIFKMRCDHNLESLEKVHIHSLRYYLYVIIKNMFKIIIHIVGLGYKITGNRVPAIKE